MPVAHRVMALQWGQTAPHHRAIRQELTVCTLTDNVPLSIRLADWHKLTDNLPEISYLWLAHPVLLYLIPTWLGIQRKVTDLPPLFVRWAYFFSVFLRLNKNSQLHTWSQLADIFGGVEKQVLNNSDHLNKALMELNSTDDLHN